MKPSLNSPEDGWRMELYDELMGLADSLDDSTTKEDARRALWELRKTLLENPEKMEQDATGPMGPLTLQVLKDALSSPAAEEIRQSGEDTPTHWANGAPRLLTVEAYERETNRKRQQALSNLRGEDDGRWPIPDSPAVHPEEPKPHYSVFAPRDITPEERANAVHQLRQIGGIFDVIAAFVEQDASKPGDKS